MRRIITLTALALGLSSGVALADQHRHGGNLGNRSGGVVVRDHRGGSPTYRGNNWNNRGTYTNRGTSNRGTYNRGYDRGYNRGAVVVRRPVYATSGRFFFGGNRYVNYRRPVINYHYRNYYQRPALIVENYDPMPGYIWIAGAWNWNGYEWIWTDGHYDVDQSYDSNYYDSSYDSGYDYSPGFSAGISIGGGY